MFNFFLSIFLFFVVFFLLKFFTFKYKFLLSQSGEQHQSFVSKKSIPTIGGILFFFIIIFYKNILLDQFIFLILPLFLLGLIADLKILKSPKIRFILQVLIIVIIVYYLNLTIKDLRIEFFNQILSVDILAILFTSFCILTLINGNNFIDGLNGQVLILYWIIFNFLVYLNLISFLNLSNQEILFLNLIFLIMTILNLSNQLYLGDNGVYIISIFFSYLAIKSYENNTFISPYFYAILFWYPAFENLFSIIRKSSRTKSPSNPDNLHLHHLIFFYCKKKLPNKTTLFINNLSGLIINLFNLLIIYFAAQNIFTTKYLLIILIICCSFYIGMYYFFLKYLKNHFKI